jgi:molecular chaperone DnaJ
VVCCPICGGRGFRVLRPCQHCAGEGLAPALRQLAVHVPAGIDDGGQLRLAGQGSVGRPGGPRGTVVLKLQVGC